MSEHAPTSLGKPSGEPHPTPQTAQADSTLSGRAVRASMWSLANYGLAQVLRLLSNLVLARLLFEEAFGLMALVSTFLQGLQLFSDFGINRAIVQSKHGDEPLFLNTAWTIQIARGAVLILICCLGAVPFAALYDAPILAEIIPIAGLNALFAGFNATRLGTLSRKLALGRMMLVDLGSQVIGLLGMLLWAMNHRSVWALIFGGALTAFVKMVSSHFLLPGAPNKLAFDRKYAREMFGLGRFIFVSTALTFLSSQSDRLIFGKLVSLGTLGVYNIALMLATMPVIALGQLSWNVIFPVLSRQFELNEDPSPAFRRTRGPLLLLGGWMIACLFAGGPQIIRVLYDVRYEDAGWMLRILAVSSWFGLLEITISSALLARGSSGWMAFAQGTKLIANVILIPLGYHFGGFAGALAGFALGDVFKFIAVVAGARSIGLRGFSQDLWLTVLVGVSGMCGGGLAHFLAPYLEIERGGRLLEVIIVLIGVTVLWIPPALQALAKRRAGRAQAA